MSEPTVISGYRDRNSTADKALIILEMFADDRLSVSAADVAAELAVARSTAYRYLESLVSRGFLEEAPGGGFRLGLGILKLAALARQGFGLSAVALPHMKALSERFQQTVLLTRRAGTSVVCLEREMSSGQLLRLSYERGSQLPLTAGASALVLLAWMPEEEIRDLLSSAPLPQFTRNTLSNVDDLIKRLQKIRADGYSITHAEVDPDALGIAAPVFNRRGEVVAGLSIVALEHRIDGEGREQIIEALRESASKISDILVLSDG
jgi:DNA-binding IclR family transcriptional regulator